MRFHFRSACLMMLTNIGCQAQIGKVDPNLPAYKALPGISGTLAIVGSDSLESIVNRWFNGFRKFYPGVTLKASIAGSTGAELALLEEESLLGTMNREMTKTEVAGFESKFGYGPTRLVVGLDALVMVVHPANPIANITLEQLDAMYSATRKQGIKDPITTWGALGLTGEWANRKISLQGRNERAGSRDIFHERVLLKGEFRPNVSALEGGSSIIEKVSLDSSSIGYASLSDISSMVRTVPILTSGGIKVLPTLETVTKGNYPLTHFLYIYVNKAPGKPLPAIVQAFLVYVLSKDGQSVVAMGNFPIPADVSRSTLAKLP